MDWTSGGQSPIRWQVSDLCLAPEHPSQHLHEAVINSFPSPYTCKVTFLRSRQRLDFEIFNGIILALSRQYNCMIQIYISAINRVWKKVPFEWLGQVKSLTGQITFHAVPHDQQTLRAACLKGKLEVFFQALNELNWILKLQEKSLWNASQHRMHI